MWLRGSWRKGFCMQYDGIVISQPPQGVVSAFMKVLG